jgi:hypothetical protein
MKDDYKKDKVTARDIYLPPFKDGQTAQQIAEQRNNYISQLL